MKKLLFISLLFFLVLFSCKGKKPESNGEYSNLKIRIAQQFGMLFAPVYVVQELNLLDKYLPGVSSEWSNISGGTTMNEALVAGQLDVAFMGIPPLLIAWARGVDFKIAGGICVTPVELMVKENTIRSLSDFNDTDKIAVSGIGSINHIILAMAAKRELGDAKAMDKNLIAMAHPDAYSALLRGTEIKGHFTTMPYIDFELKDGFISIVSADEIYEQGNSIVCVTTKAFHDKQNEAYKGLISALEEAIELINNEDPEVISIISKTEKISEEDAIRYLKWPGLLYDIKVYGTMGLARFMYEQGFIDKAPESTADIMWSGAVAVDE